MVCCAGVGQLHGLWLSALSGKLIPPSPSDHYHSSTTPYFATPSTCSLVLPFLLYYCLVRFSSSIMAAGQSAVSFNEIIQAGTVAPSNDRTTAFLKLILFNTSFIYFRSPKEEERRACQSDPRQEQKSQRAGPRSCWKGEECDTRKPGQQDWCHKGNISRIYPRPEYCRK